MQKKLNNKNVEIKKKSIRSIWKKPDAGFIIALIFLVALGIVFVFDTCYTADENFKNGILQIGYYGIGALACWGVSCVDLRQFKQATPWVCGFCLLLLILMLVCGKEVNGATRWIQVGPFNIQPPECAKVAFVLGLAFVIDLTRMFKYKAYMPGKINYNWFIGISFLLLIMGICIGISSMSALLTFVFLVLLVAYVGNFSRITLSVLCLLIVIGMAGMVISGYVKYTKENPSEDDLIKMQITQATMLENALEKPEDQRDETENYLVNQYYKLNFKDKMPKKTVEDKEKIKRIVEKFSLAGIKGGESGFREKRIVAWINPKQYKNEMGLQTAYGLTAISTGGIFGRGIGQGLCKFTIPESHNDYIFPTIVEETGFVGGIILITLYCFLFFRAYRIMIKCENDYGKLLACGALVVLAEEFFINIMVALNIIPSTGVCLPFISYGGTSTCVNFILAGIILAVCKQVDAKNAFISKNDIINRPYGCKSVPQKFDLWKKIKTKK